MPGNDWKAFAIVLVAVIAVHSLRFYLFFKPFPPATKKKIHVFWLITLSLGQLSAIIWLCDLPWDRLLVLGPFVMLGAYGISRGTEFCGNCGLPVPAWRGIRKCGHCRTELPRLSQ